MGLKPGEGKGEDPNAETFWGPKTTLPTLQWWCCAQEQNPPYLKNNKAWFSWQWLRHDASHNRKKRSKQFYFIPSKTMFIQLNLKEQGLASEQIICSVGQHKLLNVLLFGWQCMALPAVLIDPFMARPWPTRWASLAHFLKSFNIKIPIPSFFKWKKKIWPVWAWTLARQLCKIWENLRAEITREPSDFSKRRGECPFVLRYRLHQPVWSSHRALARSCCT